MILFALAVDRGTVVMGQTAAQALEAVVVVGRAAARAPEAAAAVRACLQQSVPTRAVRQHPKEELHHKEELHPHQKEEELHPHEGGGGASATRRRRSCTCTRIVNVPSNGWSVDPQCWTRDVAPDE